MEDKYSFRTKLIKVFLIITAAITFAASYVAISYAKNKTIIIKDEVVEENVSETPVSREAVSWVIDLSSVKKEGLENAIRISVPSSLDSSDVSVYARYDLREIHVEVPETHETYYMNNPLGGDFSNISKGVGKNEDGITSFTFSVNTPFLFDFERFSDRIVIRFSNIEEEEKPIVVIDPGHGGSSHGTRAGALAEKDIAMKIANRVSELSEDKPYRIAVTRAADFELTTTDRIACVYELSADMYIGLHVSSDVDDVKTYGEEATYNGRYFRNGLENADFADCLLKSVARSTSNLARGIFEAGEEDVILEVLDIPSAVLYCGYLSNETEAELLSNDEYIEKIAVGIIDALDKLE